MPPEYRIDTKVALGRNSRCYGGWLCLGSWILVAGGAATLFFSGFFTPADWQALESKSTLPDTLRGRLKMQERLLAQQTDELQKLQTELATVKREHSIDATAKQNLQHKLQVLTAQVSTIQQKLSLYEQALPARDLLPGLKIQALSLKAQRLDAQGNMVTDPNRYQYQVILANIQAEDTLVTGSYALSISGDLQGKAITLTLPELMRGGPKPDTSFALKYYQNLEGIVTLPDQFKPSAVKVTVQPVDGQLISTTYTWASLQ